MNGQSLNKQNKKFKRYNELHNDVNILILNMTSDIDFGIPTPYLEIPIEQVHIHNFIGKFKITTEIQETLKQKGKLSVLLY